MKGLLKNKKVMSFVLGVVGLAAVTFFGMDKESTEKILGGCQGAIEKQASE